MYPFKVFLDTWNWVAAHDIKQNFESSQLFIIFMDQESRKGPKAVEVDMFAVVLTNFSPLFTYANIGHNKDDTREIYKLPAAPRKWK